MEDLTLYSERVTPVEDDRAGFGVCAGPGLRGRARIASQATCLTTQRTSAVENDADT